MYRLQESHRQTKKLPRWIWAVCAMIYIIAAIYAIIPTTSASATPTYIEHTVQGGETLWSISRRFAPNSDPRSVVWQMQQKNGITPMIYPGQVILVPVGVK